MVLIVDRPVIAQLTVQNSDGNMHDPITYKVFSPHIHIVFLRNTVRFLGCTGCHVTMPAISTCSAREPDAQGNVFDMASLQLLAIKPKTWRDLVSDEPFKREDIITIQVRSLFWSDVDSQGRHS